MSDQRTTPPGTGWRLWTEERSPEGTRLEFWRAGWGTPKLALLRELPPSLGSGLWWRPPEPPAPVEEQWEMTWISPPSSYPASVPVGWEPCGGDRTGILCRRRVRSLAVAPGRGMEGETHNG